MSMWYCTVILPDKGREYTEAIAQEEVKKLPFYFEHNKQPLVIPCDYCKEDSPDPDCPECSGTGTLNVKENPRGKMDYWAIVKELVSVSDLADQAKAHLGVMERYGWDRQRIKDAEAAIPPSPFTYALCTSDEVWVERGEEGTLSDTTNIRQWMQRQTEEFMRYRGHTAAVCLCHS